MQPIIKWVGGKRWLAPFLSDLTNDRVSRHFEPLAGSAAVYFRSKTSNGVLCDTNSQLIITYRTIRDRTSELVRLLSKLKIDRHIFEEFRKWKPTSEIDKAVRFIYLNRTAFNGIYRVNSDGNFNVPFGCKAETVICRPLDFYDCAEKLSASTLIVGDFEEVVGEVGIGDLVYFDPPYTLKHNNNGFRRYNEHLFSWKDQERLAKSAKRVNSLGALTVVSNALHRDIVDLYDPTEFTLLSINRISRVSGSNKGRRQFDEALFISRTPDISKIMLRYAMIKHFGSQARVVTNRRAM